MVGTPSSRATFKLCWTEGIRSSSCVRKAAESSMRARARSISAGVRQSFGNILPLAEHAHLAGQGQPQVMRFQDLPQGGHLAERVTVVLDSAMDKCAFFSPAEIEPASWEP